MLLNLIFALLLATADGDPAELLLAGGRVLTLDPAAPVAEAVAIRGDRIVLVGSRADCEQALSSFASVIELFGQTVTRGLVDAHSHLSGGGMSLLELDLRGCRSQQELANRVKQHVATVPVGAWVRGRGFDQSLFADGAWPTRDLLDPITDEWPAYLRRVDGHSVLVNTAALNLAGIDETTPDPPGGVIVRDASGVPTGILKETAAALVGRHLPAWTADQKRRGLRLALAEAARLGLTALADHGGDADLYVQLLQEGLLTARVSLWYDLDRDLAELAELRESLEPHREWVEFRTLKGFVDGTLGSRTAALFEPFADDPTTRGVLVIDPEVLVDRVVAADEAGFQVALHAIGDRAVSLALDAYAAAAERNGSTGRRHRVEHAQVVRPSDVERFRRLGVIASVQPCHLLSDRRFAIDRLGAERASTSYPWRSFQAAGVVLAFGSDFPVEPLDPLRNLFSAVTRASETDPSEPPYYPDQCLTLAEALAGETVGPAYAMFRETELGPLRSGSLADLVVFDGLLEEVEPAELLGMRVSLTIVGGRIVHQEE